MRVLWDHQAFSYQRHGGISRAFYELYKAKSESLDIRLTPFFGHNELARELGIQRTDLVPDFKGKIRLKKWMNHRQALRYVERNDFDLFHPTYYDSYFLPVLKKPFVVTVHDCIHESGVGNLPKREARTLAHKQSLLSRAEGIISVSESTKERICHYYPTIDPTRISIVSHGYEHFENLTPITPEKISKPYVLFVGSRKYHKNFKTLLHAFASVTNEHEISLVCAGGGAWSIEERSLIHSLGLESAVALFESVSDERLKGLYGHAVAYVSTSREEGFGIPLLEAMSSNCPLICSDIPVYREVAGEAGSYFDPNSSEELADRVLKIVQDDERRTQMVQKGRQELERYTWSSARQKLKDIYQSIA